MACRSCRSKKQTQFGAEINIHFSGLRNLDKPGVLVFPKVLVCLGAALLSLRFQKPSCGYFEKVAAKCLTVLDACLLWPRRSGARASAGRTVARQSEADKLIALTNHFHSS